MVLAQLGSSITDALRKMANATVVDDAVIDDMIKEIVTALLSADVNVKLVASLRNNIKNRINLEDMAAGVNRRRAIQAAVFDELCSLLDPGKKPFVPKKGRVNTIMFVGLQGSGKTTSCTKLAYYYQKKGWKVALVCADTFRAGAVDQLKQNAFKAKIHFFGSYTERDPVRVAEEGVEKFKAENFEIIIVDTSGRHKQEAALFEEMQAVAQVVKPDDIIFVMDSSIGQAAFDQASAFRQSVAVGSVILTKLDGKNSKGGGALSAVAATQSPVIFIGTGEHIDEFEAFNTRSFVSRLLGMGDLSGLVDKMKEHKIADQPELLKRMSQGQFSLRDMYDQFKNVLKLGSISSIMSMLPGFGQDFIPKGQEELAVGRIKGFITIMDSMTSEELDSDGKLLTPSRIMRIARGSGRQVRDVQEVLEAFKPLQKAAANMKNLKIPKNADLSNMNMNNMNMRQMAQMLPPQMMNKMGGMGGLQNMMKQMMGGGGMPGGMPSMADMAKMFGAGGGRR